MKLMIHGACGRMGRVVQRVFREKLPDADLILVDPMAKDGEAYAALADYDGKVDCIVDFSHHSAAPALTAYAVATRTPLVIATTGQTEAELASIEAAAKTVPVLFASNFSLGIVVLTALARQAAKAFPDADIEIVETHHNQKIDAPSGTAKMLLKAVDPEGSFDPVYGREGVTGKRGHEIGMHALRGGTVAGEHSVFFFGTDETLEFRHSAASRRIFAAGAVRAARYVAQQPAGLYNMDDVLNS